MAVGCPFQIIVVHEDWHIVSRELDINFYALVSETACQPQAGQRVFGCQCPAATVSDDGREGPV
jgi:hypothetical protein